ncbi:hypothetical protein [Aminobacter sp. LjRoot7]|uniref:hypothetical protein n=1 Tax=Aminobacter sp. LjRoot7 TaxID=3342335 RepID=UPI003ECD052D
MIPFAIDVPPPFYPLFREERRIEFDPDPAANPFSFFPEEVADKPSRHITSNSLDRTVGAARSLGSIWQSQTSSQAFDRTLAAIEPAIKQSVPGQLAEIKRMTGRSWEQLATLLGCTRQALHNWTLGEPVAKINRDRLSRLYATLRYIDQGDAGDNASLLFAAFNGDTIAEMLAQERFAEVKAAVGRGAGRPDAGWGMVERNKVSPVDHWYTRLVDSDELSPPNVSGSEPQKLRPLQLKKG